MRSNLKIYFALLLCVALLLVGCVGGDGGGNSLINTSVPDDTTTPVPFDTTTPTQTTADTTTAEDTTATVTTPVVTTAEVPVETTPPEYPGWSDFH